MSIRATAGVGNQRELFCSFVDVGNTCKVNSNSDLTNDHKTTCFTEVCTPFTVEKVVCSYETTGERISHSGGTATWTKEQAAWPVVQYLMLWSVASWGFKPSLGQLQKGLEEFHTVPVEITEEEKPAWMVPKVNHSPISKSCLVDDNAGQDEGAADKTGRWAQSLLTWQEDALSCPEGFLWSCVVSTEHLSSKKMYSKVSMRIGSGGNCF